MKAPLMTTEKALFNTIRLDVEYDSGARGTGTGFFTGFLTDEEAGTHVPVIVTNKHVVQQKVFDENKGSFIVDKAAKIHFNITISDNDDGPDVGNCFPVTLEGSTAHDIWRFHPDDNVDLCAMPYAKIAAIAKAQGTNLYCPTVKKTSIPTDEMYKNEMQAAEDILMIGYPNGLWDESNNLPLIRRGITSTHPNQNFNNKEEFVIDAACFPGSSGSPVFLHNQHGYSTRTATQLGTSRFYFLGVLYAGPTYTAEGEISVVSIPTAAG